MHTVTATQRALRDLTIIPRNENQNGLRPTTLVLLPGMPLCIVCVRCRGIFARALLLYIVLSLALRGSGRTFLISRSGWSDGETFHLNQLYCNKTQHVHFVFTSDAFFRRSVILLIDATFPRRLHASGRRRATSDSATLLRFLLAESVQG